MSFDDKFVPIRTTIYETVNDFFRTAAGFFGYPENSGMPAIYERPNKYYARAQFLDNLPMHRTSWPPRQQPETWFETIFGTGPKIEAVPRYIYENKEEGFYNFYIENYKNIFFLPDPISEYIQVKLHICLDISILETIREVIFVCLFIYSQIIIIRVSLAWLIYINPYMFPWFYFVGAVDWTEDVVQGFLPLVLGVNITSSILLGIIGVIADSLNHIVFTMPFLPSEGEETKLLINQQMKDVLVFHYLPVSWYRYPIPNDLREYWYNERPDILDSMQKLYGNLGIQFLPDDVIKKITYETNISFIGDLVPTEMISNTLHHIF